MNGDNLFDRLADLFRSNGPVNWRLAREIAESLAEAIENNTGKKRETAKQQLKESIIAANDLFKHADYMLGDELSLADCTLAPLFWRLPVYGIDLGRPGVSVQGYIQRLISRPSFKTSLTRAEREMVLNATA